MKTYCLDTSGLSNPLEQMPEDIHVTLWRHVADRVAGGLFAVTTEIYTELARLRGTTGRCINDCVDHLNLEVGNDSWDWNSYLQSAERMKDDHRQFISEYNGGRKGTVGLTDLSIIAMAATMHLPVISMEKSAKGSLTRRRIPDICEAEDIEHLSFSDFLRRERITI